MILTLTPRENTINLSQKIISLDLSVKNADFINQIESEVMKLIPLTKEQMSLFKTLKKKWKEELKKYGTTQQTFALAFLPATTPAVIPPELIQIIVTIIIIIAVIGVGGAMAGLMMAGIWKMAFGKAKSDEWTQNILKGLTQVLGAPVIVALIVAVFVLLFSHLPAFHPILEPIKTFFHQ